MLSRETSFLTQNVVFVVIMAATFLGTIFPSISEWVTGDKISLNAPYFKRVNGPIFVVLLILMGAAPLLAWRRSAPETLRRNFLIPIVAGLLSVPVLFLLGNRTTGGFVGVAIMAFVVAGIVQEYVRGVRARRQATGEPVPHRAGRTWCGATAGATAATSSTSACCWSPWASSATSSTSRRARPTWRKGESMTVANYTLTYEQAGHGAGPELHRVHRADDAVARTAGRSARSCPRSTSTTRTRSSR